MSAKRTKNADNPPKTGPKNIPPIGAISSNKVNDWPDPTIFETVIWKAIKLKIVKIIIKNIFCFVMFFLLVDPTGLEPVISSLQMRRSTTELRARFIQFQVFLL